MEWYFRFGFDAKNVPNYDCRDSDRRSGRVSYLAGVLFLLYGTIIETLYIFVLVVLLQKKYLKSSCYKIMISLAIYNVAAIALVSLLSGYFWFVGANYCMHPNLQFISGAALSGCWCASCINGLILAFNRVLHICSKTLTHKVFHGNRTYIVLTLPLLYFLYFTFFAPPLAFNSDQMAWSYNPLTGNHPRSVYINYAHIVNNFLVVTLTWLLYIIFSRVVFQNSTISRSLFRRHKSFILQTLLICSMNLMASMTYVSMDFILVSDWFALAGYIFWNLDHELPA